VLTLALAALLVSSGAGYRLKATNTTTDNLPNSEIELCPRGQVSFYEGGARFPPSAATCIACADLDPTRFAHTFAPRRGMSTCTPCPAGTVPKTSNSVEGRLTFACEACPNGRFRDAYTVRCAAGGAGGRLKWGVDGA